MLNHGKFAYTSRGQAFLAKKAVSGSLSHLRYRVHSHAKRMQAAGCRLAREWILHTG